jgi:hypothetical protein
MPSYSALTVVGGSVITSAWGNNVRDSAISTVTSSTRPSPSTTGMVVYESDTGRYAMCTAGGSPGTWVYALSTGWVDNSGTVLFSMSGWSSVTITESKWKWTNGMVDYFVKVAAGAGTGGTSGFIYVDGTGMPAPSINGQVVGSFQYFHAASGVNYVGVCSVANASGTPRFSFITPAATNSFGLVPSFTYGNGDVLQLALRYRAS